MHQPPQHPQLAAVRASHGFRTSSPLQEVDETNCSVGDADDLWDAASLDYPGRYGTLDKLNHVIILQFRVVKEDFAPEIEALLHFRFNLENKPKAVLFPV